MDDIVVHWCVTDPCSDNDEEKVRDNDDGDIDEIMYSTKKEQAKTKKQRKRKF